MRSEGASTAEGGDPELQASHEQCVLTQDEIWRVVSDASRKQSTLSTTRHARRIQKAFPASGLTVQAIADALIYAAVDAGVIVEMRQKAETPANKQAWFSLAALRDAAGGRRIVSPKTSRTFAIQAT